MLRYVALTCFDCFAGALPFYIFFQGRGERAYDIFSRLLKERIVCVMGPVSY